ncbi:MAG: DUF1800 domain-containing protein [Candidatus Saccharibacteria bacterium]|nr:DUF1800 domain-containing protein [Rhodoferax sp.]
MQKPLLAPSSASRRKALKNVSFAGLLGLGTAHPVLFAADGDAISTPSAVWRAVSRVGYGPTPALISDIAKTNSPRSWALTQLDAAWAASQHAPRIEPDLAAFNASLPELMESTKREREARKLRKANEVDDGGSPQLRRMEFSADIDPVPFSRTMVQQASAWRLISASQPEVENPLLARLTEFWFNHLNVYVGKGSVRPFTGHYLVNVARAHALGKFEDLLLASARHPAMLGYLDQAQSVADGTPGPQGKTRGLNENYARELMELHTLGVDGGYSQTDVRELARVLTGWTISPQDVSGFRFANRLHDNGRKVVLGTIFPREGSASGEQEGIDAIRMLARHPATGRRISLRLAKFFVADEPPISLVGRLAESFMGSQGDLRIVMRVLLQSPEFWDPKNRLFKTPMDYALSALAATTAARVANKTPEPGRRALLQTVGFLAGAGQPLLGWQTPNGYTFDAATWLVPEALTRRADFALALAHNLPELDFLAPHLSAATLDAVAKGNPQMRAGLMLASPEFMSK